MKREQSNLDNGKMVHVWRKFVPHGNGDQTVRFVIFINGTRYGTCAAMSTLDRVYGRRGYTLHDEFIAE